MLGGAALVLYCSVPHQEQQSLEQTLLSTRIAAPQEGATALDRALRAACTHGHTEVALMLLGALGAGRQEAKAASSSEEVQRDGDGAGGDGNEGSMLGVEHFPGAPRTPPVVPLPLPLLLSTALGDAATCGDRGVVELLLEVRGGGGGGMYSNT